MGDVQDGLKLLVEIENPCYAGWPGCDDSYTRGHYCIKAGGHAGLHVCTCGARAGKKADAVSDQTAPGGEA